jgi:hypothetical protein
MLTRILRTLWDKRRQQSLHQFTDAERIRLSALAAEHYAHRGGSKIISFHSEGK